MNAIQQLRDLQELWEEASLQNADAIERMKSLIAFRERLDLPLAIAEMERLEAENAEFNDRLQIVRDQLETAESRVKESVQKQMAELRAENAELRKLKARYKHVGPLEPMPYDLEGEA